MPIECVKTNIPILVNTLSMSEVMRLATPTGVNLTLNEKADIYDSRKQTDN